MGQGQQLTVLWSVAVSEDAGELGERKAFPHQACLLIANALAAKVAAGKSSPALLKRRTQQLDSVLLAPMNEIQIQAAGNHHDSITPALVPSDPFHGLWTQRGRQHVPRELPPVRLQLMRWDAPEAESANHPPDQRAGDEPRLVSKDER